VRLEHTQDARTNRVNNSTGSTLNAFATAPNSTPAPLAGFDPAASVSEWQLSSAAQPARYHGAHDRCQQTNRRLEVQPMA
jgi:hypothetical protein